MHVDRHLLRLLRLQIEQVHRAKAIEDDGVGTGRGRLDVASRVLRIEHAADALARHVARVKRHRPFAVREEINRVADPHRIEIGRILPFDFGDRRVGQVGNPNRAGAAAAIMLQRTHRAGELRLVRVRHVDDSLAVRRKRARLGHGQGQLGRGSARRRHGEEPQEAAVAVPRRAEDDLLAVVGPADGNVRIGMMGHADGHPTGRRDHVDVEVALIFAGKGDRLPVRRKDRIALETDARGEPPRLAPFAGDNPQVAGIGEGNLRRTDGGQLQQQGRIFRSRLRVVRGGRPNGHRRPRQSQCQSKQTKNDKPSPKADRTPAEAHASHHFVLFWVLRGGKIREAKRAAGHAPSGPFLTNFAVILL